MAGTSLLTLIDDIATILDDIAILSKVAAKKTAGVLGDDLALNAQQVTGLHAHRELPVVWAVAKGSFINKLVLVPSALAISAFFPWAVTPLLMLGGLYLCFEGMEKIAHKLLHGQEEDARHHREHVLAVVDNSMDMVAFERDKVRGAIRTDFILSAEIIVITLGTVAAVSFGKQVMVLSVIAILMTVGVYGLVAGIVKLDDAGVYLSRRQGPGLWTGLQQRLGIVLLGLSPRLMKTLSIAGTAAMFLVGGGILVHGLPVVHHLIRDLALHLGTLALLGPALALLAPLLLDALTGMIAGGIILAALEFLRARKRITAS